MRPNDGVAPQPLREDVLPEAAVMLADAAMAVIGAPLPADREQRTLDLLIPIHK